MNWYKKAGSMDPQEWGKLYEKLKKKLGHIPTTEDMYNAKTENMFGTADEIAKREDISDRYKG